MISTHTFNSDLILSDVGEVGEYRIKSSAKAFDILSSKLYSDKIMAIVRELSCNAWDSHIAAGKMDVPFDVHLPSTLEPWFSVKDYGVGLDNAEIHTIYTTYFDSTKTDSNDYIGALGLGSKSPFSYVKSFTVTSIKDGIRRVYSAFINDKGVPSTALMAVCDTEECNGVEVSLAVANTNDFALFRSRASQIYAHFPVMPNIIGVTGFTVQSRQYEIRDIVPNVHVYKILSSYSYAVMGCVAYPIILPHSTSLDGLERWLDCNLELHFGIGELDIQASREGLSYIPSTIDAIKNKLQEIHDSTYTLLEQQTNALATMWDKVQFLTEQSFNSLWQSAVTEYCNNYTTTDAPFIDLVLRTIPYTILADALAAKYNINIRSFSASRGSIGMVSKNANIIDISIGKPTCNFVIGETKDAYSRAEYHWKKNSSGIARVYVLTPIDPDTPMLYNEFFQEIYNPPAASIIFSSTLDQKPRAVKSVKSKEDFTVLALSGARITAYTHPSEIGWRDAGTLSMIDPAYPAYYIPLCGYEMIGKSIYQDAKELYLHLCKCGIPELANLSIYGIRKTYHKHVVPLKNWINIEDHIPTVMNNITMDHLRKMAFDTIMVYRHGGFSKEVAAEISIYSPYAKIVEKYHNIRAVPYDKRAFLSLQKAYSTVTHDIESIRMEMQNEIQEIIKRYPLLPYIHTAEKKSQIDYVNMVDAQVGISA
jgi:hypothetical protein